MKNNASLPCITALVLLFVIALCYHWKIVEQQSTYDKEAEDQLIEQVNLQNTWGISFQQAVRKDKHPQIAASDNCIYLADSLSSCVDVYNHTGEFQYAIIFPNCQNGMIRIRCEDNYLVVRDKNNIVYIFDGLQEIERMDHRQATTKGYSSSWFSENTALQKTDGQFYIETDQEGAVVRRLPLPTQNSTINVLRVVIFIIAVIIHLFALLRFLILKNATS